MKVVTLLEKESQQKGLKSSHGLSLYIELQDKKILFDVGPGTQYISNAMKLGVDLSDVDYLFVSHGHYDHGKRIKSFMKLNKKAQVYLSAFAFDGHYKKIGWFHVPIGIPKLKPSNRVHLITENTTIGEGIQIITNVKLPELVIPDTSLEKKEHSEIMRDDFNHELYVVLSENNAHVLFSGCSHKGIENIIDSIEKSLNTNLQAVVGGFHFAHYDTENAVQTLYLKTLANKFKQSSTTSYYTGHCTGNKAYEAMSLVMNDKLKRFKSGLIFEV